MQTFGATSSSKASQLGLWKTEKHMFLKGAAPSYLTMLHR